MKENILAKYTEGPKDGIFTDGGARPNPGPGGWAFVHVRNDKIVSENHATNPDTTNNRMEITAIIEALKYLPTDSGETIYSDSNLCVQTLNTWAKGWEKKGWKRSSGPIANLELVKEAWELFKAHPNIKLVWIKAHNGWRWNEYVDYLATSGLITSSFAGR